MQEGFLVCLVERLCYFIVALSVPSRNTLLFRIYRNYQIKNKCIQLESYLASNIRVVITALKKIKTAKAQTSSFSESNIFVWEQRANFSAINYFKVCSFCSKGFLLPLCVLDWLCYFLVALPGPSI